MKLNLCFFFVGKKNIQQQQQHEFSEIKEKEKLK